MNITFSSITMPYFSWTKSKPLIDLVLPHSPGISFSWNQREGWARALIELGYLNRIFWVWDNEQILNSFFADIKDSNADLVLIMCADHHQYWLHDNEKKRDFWRRFTKPVICHSIERVINSPFPDSIQKTQSALNTFDGFLYIDELSESLFTNTGKPSMWIPQYVDETVFKPTIPFEHRHSKIHFRGKITNFGITGLYEQRRLLYATLSGHPLFDFADASTANLTIQDAARVKALHKFAINLAANCTGYSASLYEILACGCVALQYKLPEKEIKSRQLFKNMIHFIEYDPYDIEGIISLAEEVTQNWKDYEIIARNGYEECLSKHTIKKRIQEVIEFIENNWHRLTKNSYQDTIYTIQSELDNLIAPEVKGDEFYHLLKQLASKGDIKTVLEIGASSGEGSTEALTTGLKNNPNYPKVYLFTLEVSKPRFQALKDRYKDEHTVKPFNMSSVSIDDFAPEDEVKDFYTNHKTNLNQYQLERVLGWLKQDIDYLQRHAIKQDGIKNIKQDFLIGNFDLVLIDGSEFTGKAELDKVYGAKYIALDDINAFKNFHNYQRLKSDPDYDVIAENLRCRNGFAVFRRRDAFTDYEGIINSIDGLLIKGQEKWLFEKVRSLKDDSKIIEIGAYKGKSTVSMGLACKNTKKVIYSIDTWDGNETDFGERDFYNIWQKNISESSISRHVIPLKGKSHEQLQKIQDNSIDFVFIDGSHQFLDVMQDFLICFNKAKIGAQIAFHDVVETWQGPYDLWHMIAKHILDDHEYCHSIACGKKNKDYPLDSTIPIHFFCIVINGMLFIDHHINVFKQLPFKWHWHIVEGIADLKHDTAWSVPLGGTINDKIHRDGLSIDGTTEYLDRIAKEYPDNVTLYRKEKGQFWDGKLEMVSAPLQNIKEECLLFQIDADELWTLEQICAVRAMFMQYPDKTSAYYYCHYHVGKDLIITSHNTYGNNTSYEWLRTWRYKPGDFWLSHEPPRLCRRLQDDTIVDLGKLNPIMHEETKKRNLIFTHYAYVTEQQILFKEVYYGYKDALKHWQRLQAHQTFPILLKDFFPWVTDNAVVDKIITVTTRQQYKRQYESIEGLLNDIKTVKRILWVRTDSIGDHILSMPMLEFIKARFNDAEIYVLCQEHIAEIYMACPYVHGLVTFDRQKSITDTKYREDIIKSLRQYRFDLAINSVYSREAITDFYAVGSGARGLIASEGDDCNMSMSQRIKNNKLYDLIIPIKRKAEIQRHIEFLSGFSIHAPNLQPDVWVTPEDTEYAESFFKENSLDPHKTIALTAGAQYGIRFYEYYGKALKEICERENLTVIGLGSNSDDAIIHNNLSDIPTQKFNLCGKTTLCQASTLINKCSIVIGSENALAHIACAVGIPNVILIGGGHFGRFMPYSNLTTLVCLPLDCYHCNWICKYDKPYCIKGISPEVLSIAISDGMKRKSDKAKVFMQRELKFESGSIKLNIQKAIDIIKDNHTPVEIIEI